NVGTGEADVLACQPQDVCNNDHGFYMVFEAFENTPNCLSSNPPSFISIFIARSNTLAGPWSVQDSPWLGAHQGCGRDQPSWQYTPSNNRYRVILSGHSDSPGNFLGLQRNSLGFQ